MVSQIINLYGAQLLGTLLVALFGALGMAAKKIAERVLDTPLKAQLARIAVQCVEPYGRRVFALGSVQPLCIL